VAEQRYYPYGETRWSWGTLPTDYTFTGQRNEAGIGLMDYRARYYSPYLNRWIQPDPIIPDLGNPQSLNRFMYVFANPLKLIDPSGYDPRLELVGREWTLAEIQEYRAVRALYRVIQGEQSGMGYESKEAAGAVVLNRASNRSWSAVAGWEPGSHESVFANAYRPGQFEGHTNVSYADASASYQAYKQGKLADTELEDSWNATHKLMDDYERLGTEFYGSHERVGNASYFGNLHDGPVTQNPDGTYRSITEKECPQCQTALDIYNERGANQYGKWDSGLVKTISPGNGKLFFYHNINPVGCNDLNFP
jgi:RHS repeat-associated protein